MSDGPAEANGCEHGCDRAAEPGKRFCSPECEACEHAPADAAGLVDHAVWCCAGLCDGANGYGVDKAGVDHDGEHRRFTMEHPEGEVLANGPSVWKRESEPKAKPDHYKVICVSFYTEDLQRLDGAVKALKAMGHSKASRSSVLRAAMLQVDLSKVPRAV